MFDIVAILVQFFPYKLNGLGSYVKSVHFATFKFNDLKVKLFVARSRFIAIEPYMNV